MTVNKVKYSNFRNLSDVELEFSDGVNVLYGMNAQGKSNILEGIYYFARGRSFRGAKEKDLVAFGENTALWELEMTKAGGKYSTLLRAAVQVQGKKRLFRNGAPLKNPAEMLGTFRSVLFCPAHLSIVGGGPAERRAFLDIAIAQNSSSYVYYLSNYRRFLAERNALLKRYSSGVKVSREEWETYAAQLSLAAAEIYTERSAYCQKLSDAVCGYFTEMTSGGEIPNLHYASHVGVSESGEELFSEKEVCTENLYNRLVSNIEREAAAGSTLWGPHKDDIKITLNERDARLFASQGQQRSIALSMKLAEGEISKQLTGEYPAFLLDDVFSELDSTRRAFIMEKLTGRQIIVTSCEPGVIPGKYGDTAKFFEVRGGRVYE